jgi:hypothetical protein
MESLGKEGFAGNTRRLCSEIIAICAVQRDLRSNSTKTFVFRLEFLQCHNGEITKPIIFDKMQTLKQK